MATDPSIRASDADRDRVAALLAEHFGQGRLTQEEFSERLDAAYAAKRLGDLTPLLEGLPIDEELPSAGLSREPGPRPAGDTGRRPGPEAPGYRDRPPGHRGVPGAPDPLADRMAARMERFEAGRERMERPLGHRMEHGHPRLPVAGSHELRAAWAAWAFTGGLCTLIWLLTGLGDGDKQGFWPIWVIGPWGLVLLARAIRGSDGPERDGGT